jgi:parallel beta-helix repeat protein
LLRVGERWATRARHPNADPQHPYTGGWLFADADPDIPAPAPGSPSQQMRYRPGDVPPYADVTESEVHIFIAWSWLNAIVPLARQDLENRRLVFAGNGASQDVRPGNRYFIENVREALDAPGEWFHDKARREVLYIPDMAAFPDVPVVAAHLDHLVCCAGNPAAGRFVEHVRFVGFRFADTNYTVTDQYYVPQDACIVMSGARHCEIRDCEFSWLGGYALKLMDRTEHCAFLRNRVHHVGQGGVIATGSTENQAHHCVVAANRMEYLGLIYKHVAGVYISSGCDHRVAHNRIVEVPRYAISIKSAGEQYLSHRNVIEYNEIRRCNLETNDTGAIETLGYEKRDSGNIIRYNLILDSLGMISTPEGVIQTPHFTWGVYLDDFSSGTTIYGNIIVRTTTGGVCIHAGQNNVVENNIIVDGLDRQVHLHPESDFMKGNRFVRNIVVYARPEAELFYLFQAWRENQPGRFDECNHNLYWLSNGDLNAVTAKITPDGTFADWRAKGFDADSLVADPLFLNAAADDYRLSEDSPAFTLGFKPIPVHLIGPDGFDDQEHPVGK